MSHAQYSVGPYFKATPFFLDLRWFKVSFTVVAAILGGLRAPLCSPTNCDFSSPTVNQPCDQTFVWPLTESQLKQSEEVCTSVWGLHVKKYRLERRKGDPVTLSAFNLWLLQICFTLLIFATENIHIWFAERLNNLSGHLKNNVVLCWNLLLICVSSSHNLNWISLQQLTIC